MKKSKRLLAAILTVMLTLTLFPTIALAADPVDVSNYTELITALKDDTVDIINITQSFAIRSSETALQVQVNRGANVTINGNGFTITGNSSGRILWLGSTATYTFTVNGLTFTGSSTTSGNGGAVNLSGVQITAVFNDCIFTNNHTDGSYGGALYHAGDEPHTLTLNRCIFTGNSAGGSGSGGAVAANYDATVTDCVFTNNQAEINAGALRVNETATVTNCTFTNNSTANLGGALYLSSLGTNSTFENCTFLGNTAVRPGNNIYSMKNIIFKGTNTVSRGSEASSGDWGLAFGVTMNYTEDGGPGSNLAYVGFENASSYTELIAALEDDTVDIINITADFAIQPDETSLQVRVDRGANVTINGNGYTITGNNSGRILWLDDTDSYTLTVNDLTFTGSSITSGQGGAVNLHGTQITAVFTNCIFTNNRATGGAGGALYHVGEDSHSLTLNSSTFSGNISYSGGGAVYATCDATITDCLFTNNQSEKGGALYVNDTATVTGCTFINNNASDMGGAVYIGRFDLDSTFKDCIFLGNAAVAGSNIYSEKDIIFKGANAVSRDSEAVPGDYGLAFAAGKNYTEDDGNNLFYSDIELNLNYPGAPVGGFADLNADKKLNALPPAPTRSGYAFLEWFDAATGGTAVTTNTAFAYDDIIFAQWMAVPPAPTNNNPVNNSTTNPQAAAPIRDADGKHDDVVITLTPNGNTLNNLVYNNNNLVKDIDYTVDGNKVTIKGEYLDTLTAGEHTLTFDMNQGADQTVTITISERPWQNPFTDANENDWFYEEVKYVCENGLFAGTSENTFSPYTPMMRTMVFTVLARLAGVETVGGETWYSLALRWGMEIGLTDGTNPNGNVTREQLVTLLWRYAGSPVVSAELDGFHDADTLSDWAIDAMAWAVSLGIICGDDSGALNPNDGATRAEVAAMLHRFCEAVK